MATSLLKTKLHIPPLRSTLVSRPHLVQRLDDGLRLGRRLTLVSAPAGFGKTTLLSEWVHCRDKAALPAQIGWLSLDSGDNDPTRFWTYFMVAVRIGQGEAEMAVHDAAIGGTTSALLQPSQPVPVEAMLTALIDERVARPETLVVILDDYHLIEALSIHEALTFLLDHMPPPPHGIHLIVATRADPPLSLARLRAQGQLTELRAADLRFTPGEAAAFLREMGLYLSDEAVAAQRFRESYDLGQRCGNYHAGISALRQLSWFQLEQGQRREIVSLCQQAIATCVDSRGKPLPIAGGAYIAMGQACYQANELIQARQHLLTGTDLLAKTHDPFPILWGQVLLAQVYQALGEKEASRATWGGIFQTVSRLRWEWGSNFFKACKADFQSRQGDIAAASRWLEANFSPTDTPQAGQRSLYLMYARVRLAQGQPQEARQALIYTLWRITRAALRSIILT